MTDSPTKPQTFSEKLDGALSPFGGLPIIEDPYLPIGTVYICDLHGNGALTMVRHRPWTRRERVRNLVRRWQRRLRIRKVTR